jgi:hypothetical protein
MIEQIAQWFLKFIDKLIGYSPNDDAYDDAKVVWSTRDQEIREKLEEMRKDGLL